MFVFKKCRRQRVRPMCGVIKKASAKNDILSRLRAFLDSEEPQTVEFLVSTWGNQQSAITYAELREAILSGEISAARLEQWRVDYSKFVTENLALQWEKAMTAASQELVQKYPYFLYNPQNQFAQDFIRQCGAFFVTNIVEEQRDAIQAAILHSLNLDNAMTADDLSRLLRPMIGLTKPQAIANVNHYNAVKLELLKVNPNMRLSTAEKMARESAVRYAHRQERYRAFNVARTELATAYNQGSYAATFDAQAQGYIGDCKKTWLTAFDERVCSICAPLDGQSVNMTAMFSVGVEIPPAHPSCRCAVVYQEISPPLLTNPAADGIIVDTGGVNDMDVEETTGAGAFDREQRIRQGEQSIANNSHETAIVYDSDGKEDDISELKESIKTHGLLVPIVVSQNYVIISGHKRIRACRELGHDKIKVMREHYETETDEIIALINYNSSREKTADQKARENLALIEAKGQL